MTCRTPNCERAVPFEGHVYCDECFPIVWRTGSPPELAPRRAAPEPFVPGWLARSRRQPNGLARDLTGTVAA